MIVLVGVLLWCCKWAKLYSRCIVVLCCRLAGLCSASRRVCCGAVFKWAKLYTRCECCAVL